MDAWREAESLADKAFGPEMPPHRMDIPIGPD